MLSNPFVMDVWCSSALLLTPTAFDMIEKRSLDEIRFSEILIFCISKSGEKLTALAEKFSLESLKIRQRKL